MESLPTEPSGKPALPSGWLETKLKSFKELSCFFFKHSHFKRKEIAREKKKPKKIYSKPSNYKNRRKKKSNKGAAMIEHEHTLQNVLTRERNRNIQEAFGDLRLELKRKVKRDNILPQTSIKKGSF